MELHTEAVLAIAREAGKITLQYHRKDMEVTQKSDSSPVTQADLQADAYIQESLKALDPSIPILSEEGGTPPYEERQNWKHFWLVDPLDGTKEFIRGGDDYTVNIALLSDNQPILGVIYAPVQKLLYYGAQGAGTWKQVGQAAPLRIYSRPTKRSEPQIIVESRSHPSDELETFLTSILVRERVKVGSSIKFCYLAEGTATLYPRFGPTNEWDVAAGDAIYRYSAREGANPSPLKYNKPNILNGSFVIGGTL